MIKTILIIIGVILILVAYKVLDELENKLKPRKDLELTIDDIKNIDRFLNQCVDYSNPYQEALKRFNEYRQKK